MSNKNFNDDKGLVTHITFKYSDDSRLFNNWKELIEFWTPYYKNRTDADSHLRKIAYGVAVAKDGTPIISAPVSGPLTTEQKADLITRASEYIR